MKTHGLWNVEKPTYQVWQDMKQRCYNSNHREFKRYGARGIGVCCGWRDSFQDFFRDMGRKPDGLSLHRIDNSGSYRVSNCKWATDEEQQSNSRQARRIWWNGKCKNIGEWSRELGVHRATLQYRIKVGLPLTEAMK